MADFNGVHSPAFDVTDGDVASRSVDVVSNTGAASGNDERVRGFPADVRLTLDDYYVPRSKPIRANGSSPITSSRVTSSQASILKSPTLQLASFFQNSFPTTKSLSSSASPSVTSTTPSSHQHPVASSYLVPYHLVDIEVQLKPGCHDIMLEGKVGVVSKIAGKMATIHIKDNSSDISIPHESLVPVSPRLSDTVKVIGGSETVLGLIGTLVSKIGNDGIVQFFSYNRQRRRNPAQIPLSQLGRYTPKSKFASGYPSTMVYPHNALRVANNPVSTATGKTQLVYPVQLVAVPSAQGPSLGALQLFPAQSSLSLLSSTGMTFPVSSSILATSRLNPSSSLSSSAAFGTAIEADKPDSTTPDKPWENVEQDSAVNKYATPQRARVPTTNSRMNSGMIGGRFSSSLANSSMRLDVPTGNLLTYPIQSKVLANPTKLKYILSQASSANNVVDRGGNGYSISDILDKLVRNQRNYTYELTSPTKPGSSSHDIKTSCVRVSLVCPLSQRRMKYPSRGKFCKHLQCFDAENYIYFHEKQRVRKKIKQIGGHYGKQALDKKWRCPICERITHIPHLYIDKALMKLVKESTATEVELNKSGCWVPVNNQVVEVIDLTGD